MGPCVHHLVQYSQTNRKKVNLGWCFFSNPVPQKEFLGKECGSVQNTSALTSSGSGYTHTASTALKNTGKRDMIISKHTKHYCRLLNRKAIQNILYK